MSTALRREHHSRSKCAPRAGERPKSVPAEPQKCYSSSGAHPTNLILGRLMSATHIASDDFEADMHLDSAGDSLGGLFRANEDDGPEVLYRPLILMG